MEVFLFFFFFPFYFFFFSSSFYSFARIRSQTNDHRIIISRAFISQARTVFHREYVNFR